MNALSTLAAGLRMNFCYDDALLVYAASVATLQRWLPNDESFALRAKNNMASCYSNMGLHDQAVRLQREIHTRGVALYGVSDEMVLVCSGCLGISLLACGRFVEAQTFLREQVPLIRSRYGSDHNTTLKSVQALAASLSNDPASTRENRLEAKRLMQDVVERRVRVYGRTHPTTRESERFLSRCA